MPVSAAATRTKANSNVSLRVEIEPASAQRSELSRLVEETAPANVHLVTETLRPSARGRRYKNSRNCVSVLDGPFTESKELIGGRRCVC
jgi:hypothetical protein